ncbi:galactokinase [Peribacillus frigoritolerans]|uniref:Galactokinase n=1 Tax=Peribacillus frigoritolerans TaxID=450367 RepID=A0AAJ1QQ73_9BACI|nr:galactokinase [Peribacillus frigoritolerans]MDM5285536.1 galactokinase [Peribacillus frigoritolerans]
MNAIQLRQLFRDQFGYEEGVRIFFAPGRVNLIGEHTDYNGGYVFPAALTYGTWAAAAPSTSRMYRFASANFPSTATCTVTEELLYREEDDWANYPKGVLKELLQIAGLEDAEKFIGADVLYYGNIPNGAGLSSSASIELVTGLALSKLADFDIPMMGLVEIGQKAENRFVGVNCGIMDQFAVGMGRENHAMVLKCDTLSFRYVPLEIDGYKLVITNTNKRRGLADSKYNERRAQCEEGLSIIQQQLPLVRNLGDVSLAEWEKVHHFIEDDVIHRRVEHVIKENERVLAATKSLQDNDLYAFGARMKQSHVSLRDLYEVTGFELDTLFEEASKVEGCVGTRMTGAGFGGCSVSLVKEEAVDEFKEKVAKNYSEKTGLEPIFYVCEIGDGAKEMYMGE